MTERTRRESCLVKHITLFSQFDNCSTICTLDSLSVCCLIVVFVLQSLHLVILIPSPSFLLLFLYLFPALSSFRAHLGCICGCAYFKLFKRCLYCNLVLLPTSCHIFFPCLCFCFTVRQDNGKMDEAMESLTSSAVFIAGTLGIHAMHSHITPQCRLLNFFPPQLCIYPRLPLGCNLIKMRFFSQEQE